MIDLGPQPIPIDMARPRLAAGVRLARDSSREGWVLLGPESVCPLTGTAPEILALCDGRRSIGEIAASLAERYRARVGVVSGDIASFLQELASGGPAPATSRDGPAGLLAELTHRCPLHCEYCSNPVDPPTRRGELDQAGWSRVLSEAAALGVLQVHFSGGEPLLRPDLPDLVAQARSSGLYTNLITSGFGLNRARAARLRSAGLDHAQISLQADEPTLADTIAGITSHRRKLDAARAIVEEGIALTINVVLHRGNLDRLSAIIAVAESLGAARIELAHTQFYGWAWRNRARLIPNREQVARASAIVAEAVARLGRRVEVIHVVPDYFGDRPKPCMNGWGRRQLTVDPVGDVLPCPTAREIPSLRFENVRDRSLAAIWQDSEAFNRFRGTSWMPEPCRSCDRREIDFGGCRCQAFLLSGDASATDPACSLSPHRETLTRLLALTETAGAGATRDGGPVAGALVRRGPGPAVDANRENPISVGTIIS
jgi:pyrroloquinoline quinone biosynthesis protein E